MPIDATHPMYKRRRDQWSLCMDLAEGAQRIREQGQTYLPKLSGMNETDYVAYLTRASFFNALGRTVEALVGAMMRVDPVIEVPDQLKPFLDDITGSGISIVEFIKDCVRDVLMFDRCGTLVDMAAEGNGRPYFARYSALDIINWGADFVVMREDFYEPDPADPYILLPRVRFRELRMVDGRYQQIVHNPVDAKDANGKVTGVQYAAGLPMMPVVRGVGWDVMPFVWMTATGNDATIGKAPMLDLAEVNVSHWRNSADYEHGLHFTALPTPWVSGLGSETQELRIGSQTAWILPDPSCRAGYLEFSGVGLKTIEVAMQRKEEQMAILGARLLGGGPNGVEAAETARIHQSGETNTLSGVATSVEAGVKRALDHMIRWVGASGEAKVTMNRDFLDMKVDPAMLTAMVSSYQGGTISLDTLLWNLKRGDMLPPEVTVDEEKERIELTRPQLEPDPNGNVGKRAAA